MKSHSPTKSEDTLDHSITKLSISYYYLLVDAIYFNSVPNRQNSSLLTITSKGTSGNLAGVSRHNDGGRP